MEVISGISIKKRFNNIFLRNHLKKIFKMQSGVIFSRILPSGKVNKPPVYSYINIYIYINFSVRYVISLAHISNHLSYITGSVVQFKQKV
jgi:hypothetical protein